METGDWNLGQEFIRSLLSAASGIAILAAGWFVGQKLTYQWNLRQKQREIQLDAAQQFYTAYGEFFAVWKLWNRLEAGSPYEDRRWELHKRAAAAEAIIEGTLVKLTSELTLSGEQLNDLGSFRQAFQQLRQSIRQSDELPWNSSEDAEYQTFKVLAVRISLMLGKEWTRRPVSSDRAAYQLLRVTSNYYEGTWVGRSAHHLSASRQYGESNDTRPESE